MTNPLSDLPIDDTLQPDAWVAEAQRLIRERDEELYAEKGDAKCG